MKQIYALREEIKISIIHLSTSIEPKLQKITQLNSSFFNQETKALSFELQREAMSLRRRGKYFLTNE